MKYLYALQRWTVFAVVISIASVSYTAAKAQPKKVPPLTTAQKMETFPPKPRFLLEQLYREGKFSVIIESYTYKPKVITLTLLTILLVIYTIIPLYTIALYIHPAHIHLPYANSQTVKYGIIPANALFLLILWAVIISYQRYYNEGRLVFTDEGFVFVDSRAATEAKWGRYENVKAIAFAETGLRVEVQKDFAFCYFNHIKNDAKVVDIFLFDNSQISKEDFDEIYQYLTSICMKYKMHLAAQKIKKDTEEASQRVLKEKDKPPSKVTTQEVIHPHIPAGLKRYISQLSKENGYHVTKVIDYYPFRRVTLTELTVSFTLFAALLFLIIKTLLTVDDFQTEFFYIIALTVLTALLKIDSLNFIPNVFAFFSPAKYHGYVLTKEGLFILHKHPFHGHAFFSYQDMTYLLLHPLDFEQVSLLDSTSTLHVLSASQLVDKARFKHFLDALQEQIVIAQQQASAAKKELPKEKKA